MYIWTDAEIQCSGKSSNTELCSSTFSAKVQMHMPTSSIATNVATGVTAAKGVPPEGWLTIVKEYYSVPYYFCPKCERYAKDLETRP